MRDGVVDLAGEQLALLDLTEPTEQAVSFRAGRVRHLRSLARRALLPLDVSDDERKRDDDGDEGNDARRREERKGAVGEPRRPDALCERLAGVAHE